MTVIAYKDGIIAADSLLSDRYVKGGSVRKVERNAQGWLAGAAGDAGPGMMFLREFKTARSPLVHKYSATELESEIIAMIVSPKGEIYLYSSGVVFPILDSYYAIGSGAGVALAVMGCGKSAAESVAAAIGLSPWLGGNVLCLKSKK